MNTSHLVGHMTYTEVLHTLKTLSSPKKAERLFPRLKVQDKVLGVGLMKLRALSKTIKKDHDRALQLWQSGIHEAKLLATLTEELSKVSEEQMDKQVAEIKTLAVADYFTKNIVAKSPYLLQKANSWVFMDKPLMVRHIGYACVCQLAKKITPWTIIILKNTSS